MQARSLVVMAVLAPVAFVGACSDPVAPLQTAQPGVVFTYPADGQLDVPTGARVIASFSDPIDEGALGACTATSGAFCLVGPDGPVDAMPVVGDDGHTVSFPSGQLAEGMTYQLFARPELAPEARNLPSGPLATFTTRSARPRAAAPELIAINGAAPETPEAFRPLLETSTIRLVFSEPLDGRTVAMAAGSFELLDSGGNAVPATVVSSGIHVSIDPVDDLVGGETYVLRMGTGIEDLGGTPMAAATAMLTPHASKSTTIAPQMLRTRQPGDPGPARSRSGATPNEVVIDKPLIGHSASQMLPATLQVELGDPKSLDGPIAFTLRKGQRLRMTGLDIALGGEIATGLSTGEIWIELLTDAGGRMYRNPHQAPEQRPENDRAPLYVDLSMDVAVYAVDATGNAALTQTVMGLQGIGTALATDGVLAIETVSAMDMALMGVTTAPTNMVLELISDESATLTSDTVAPAMVSSYPGQSEQVSPDEGIDVVFNEPIDLARARAGGIRLEDTNGVAVEAAIESAGSGVVVRPLAPLAYGKIYRVVFDDVADAAGNKAAISNLSFTTPTLINVSVPLMVTAMYPGVPCALTGASATSPGRCAGGLGTDELYKPFTLPANEPIEVTFSQPLRRSSVTHGTMCGQGSVRIEEVDAGGACTGVVAGTLLVRDRSLAFIPDVPWVDGKTYRVTLVSGGDATCNANELCGPTTAANFDPLAGSENGDGGGPPLIVNFTGAPPTTATHMLTVAGPITDINGSGSQESGELEREENHAALRITGTTGSVSAAEFNGDDCIPGTPETENCMYIQGAMPVLMGELSSSCGDSGASSCIPVKMSPQAMLSTSTSMTATVIVPISTATGASVMRVREPSGGDVMGYIIDGGGTPTFHTTMPLYMDAPDMSVPLSEHDLHSKSLMVTLEGPVQFQADGRIAIALANTADVPVTVAISGPLDGTVEMIVPKGEMRLQLVSPAPRGRAP